MDSPIIYQPTVNDTISYGNRPTEIVKNEIAQNEAPLPNEPALTSQPVHEPAINGTSLSENTSAETVENGNVQNEVQKGVLPSAKSAFLPQPVHQPAVNGTALNGNLSAEIAKNETAQNGALPSAKPAFAPQPDQQTQKIFAPPLQGKIALITGAGRGIGAGIAKVLAEKGCKTIIINYSSSPDAAARTCRELESLGSRAIAIRADLTKVDEIVRLFQEAVDQAGGLDIVVSNSGRGKL